MSVEKKNKKLFIRLAAIAIGMFGFGYALVPFYYQICAAWGVNLVDKPSSVENTQVDKSRLVTIELDSNIHQMAWRFRPLVNQVKVHPGELMTVEYEVVNASSVPVTGQAIASYGPQLAGEYFKKLECFCFTQQTLAPGEVRRMPVIFMVDSRLPKDVNTIALSYTFFQVEGRGGRS
jgi:cytochrome c oxidase assembly protein subunit 11